MSYQWKFMRILPLKYSFPFAGSRSETITHLAEMLYELLLPRYFSIRVLRLTARISLSVL
jgi:hypothetical protein